MNVLAYSFSHGLSFLLLAVLVQRCSCFYLCFALAFAQQCCVTGRRDKGLESMAGRQVSALPPTGHGTRAKGLQLGCSATSSQAVCKGDVVGEVPGTRWHVEGSLSAVAVAFLKAECTWVWFM